jgi:putative transposase
MSTTFNPYCGFRYPAEIINQAVWLYHCFWPEPTRGRTDIGRVGIVISYEAIRE